MTIDEVLKEFEEIASLMGEACLGGSPFQSDEENKKQCGGAYEKAKEMFISLLSQAEARGRESVVEIAKWNKNHLTGPWNGNSDWKDGYYQAIEDLLTKIKEEV